MMKVARGRRAAAVGFVVAAMSAGAVGFTVPSASAAPAPPAPPARPTPRSSPEPRTEVIHGHDKVFDVRTLPQTPALQHRKLDRFVDEEPDIERSDVGGGGPSPVGVPGSAAPAPSTSANF